MELRGRVCRPTNKPQKTLWQLTTLEQVKKSHKKHQRS